jgi:hypothetical protein
VGNARCAQRPVDPGATLDALGCDVVRAVVQGDGFARPMPVADLRAWLEQPPGFLSTAPVR